MRLIVEVGLHYYANDLRDSVLQILGDIYGNMGCL